MVRFKLGTILTVILFIFGTTATGWCGNFKDNGDGTVTDVATGLTWQQADAKKNWEAAITYCEELKHANHQDWRLPNIKELRTIIDMTKTNLTIDSIAFPGAKASLYWSSTTFESNPRNAMVYDFSNANTHSEEKVFTNYVRCVR
jgi:hypothetical protein